jgi:parallel beta helix pectate lyase-like protein
MRFHFGRSTRLAFIVVMAFGLALAGPAAQQVGAGQRIATAIACGDVLGPGGNFKLTADLGPCATNPALTVIGPAKLSGKFHTVTCANPANNGIVITGKKGALKEVKVEGCNVGVSVAGTGGHLVQHVAATDNPGDDGFGVESSGNTLNNNHAADNGNNGFHVDGSKNFLMKNISERNGLAGFLLSTVGATSNQLLRNEAMNNLNNGIRVDINGTKNTLNKNTARGNGGTDLVDDSPGCDSNVWKHNRGTRSERCIG